MQPSDHHGTSFDDGVEAPVWAAFGDLMACVLGLFVLLFVALLTVQAALLEDLGQEREARVAATARLEALERALDAPLRSGLITLENGRIGIRGSVLFDLSSAELTDEGRDLLHGLVAPLGAYLEARDDILMVSGFTDDLPLSGYGDFQDNWELSAQRALTVTRELVAAGVPVHRLFAAGFGHNMPVVPNSTAENRAQNRRVELSPVPKGPGLLGSEPTVPSALGAADLPSAGPSRDEGDASDGPTVLGQLLGIEDVHAVSGASRTDTVRGEGSI